jgi:hypothetical protein
VAYATKSPAQINDVKAADVQITYYGLAGLWYNPKRITSQ